MELYIPTGVPGVTICVPVLPSNEATTIPGNYNEWRQNMTLLKTL